MLTRTRSLDAQLFIDGWYWGNVDAVDPVKRLYRIKYDDGDEEVVDEAECGVLVRNAEVEERRYESRKRKKRPPRKGSSKKKKARRRS